jgi:hypothetical protein
MKNLRYVERSIAEKIKNKHQNSKRKCKNKINSLFKEKTPPDNSWVGSHDTLGRTDKIFHATRKRSTKQRG